MTDAHKDESPDIEQDAALTGAPGDDASPDDTFGDGFGDADATNDAGIEADDETRDGDALAADPRHGGDAALAPQYGVGPFSIREVALVGTWLIAFVVSFFSIASEQVMSQLLFGGSVWTNGLDWILTIGVPTIAVFLVVLRRFSPDGIRRVGSLGIDQFASVAFSVSAVVWLTLLWRNIAVAIESEVWIYGWVIWVEFFLMLGGIVLTVFAPVIPVLAEDFSGRREVVAHRNARPVRAVSARPPRPVAPAAHKPASEDTQAAEGGYAPTTERYAAGYALAPNTDQTAYAADGYQGVDDAADTGSYDAFARADSFSAAQADEAAQPLSRSEPTDEVAGEPVADSRVQAFWALTPEERDVVDESGVPMFRIGPSAWALVLEDRGEVFVVRHDDGRVGYLHDVSGVTRG